MKKTKLIIAICSFFVLNSTAFSSSYDFFVDAGSNASVEDGSESFPFKTINAALSHIVENGLSNQNVYIKNGIYRESVNLRNNTNLFGESRNKTIINAEGEKYGIYFRSTKSQVRNLAVRKAKTNVFVDKKSGAAIDNCALRSAAGGGIVVERSTIKDKYKFFLQNSKIENSGHKGVSVSRRRIEIIGSRISRNGEEGIDLHSGVRGTVRGNEIKGNRESGIELMMEGARLSIRNNNISNNGAQGLTVQIYNSNFGKIKITGNSIRSNTKYGIRYARYDNSILKMRFQNFIKKCVKLKKNTIENNSEGDYAYK